MFKNYADGVLTSNGKGCFPKLLLIPNLDRCDGAFFGSFKRMELSEISGQLLYRNYVKAINKMKLNGRVDMPWRPTFGLLSNVKPEWWSLLTINKESTGFTVENITWHFGGELLYLCKS